MDTFHSLFGTYFSQSNIRSNVTGTQAALSMARPTVLLLCSGASRLVWVIKVGKVLLGNPLKSGPSGHGRSSFASSTVHFIYYLY